MTTQYGFFSEHEYLTPTGQKRSWKRGPGKQEGESSTAKAALRAGFASKTGKVSSLCSQMPPVCPEVVSTLLARTHWSRCAWLMQLNDATFSKHLSLHAGDQYQDAGTR